MSDKNETIINFNFTIVFYQLTYGFYCKFCNSVLIKIKILWRCIITKSYEIFWLSDEFRRGLLWEEKGANYPDKPPFWLLMEACKGISYWQTSLIFESLIKATPFYSTLLIAIFINLKIIFNIKYFFFKKYLAWTD